MATVGGPRIVRSGLVLNLDAAQRTSFTLPIIVYSVQCYSVYGGGLRSANYTVQYSDDNSTWTTAFTGVMSNNSSCGIITGTGVNTSDLTPHKYWRYVEGSAVAGHHPRVSRIDFITSAGSIINLVTYTSDNCADSGTYIVGTVSKDFGPSTWNDLSGNRNNGTFFNNLTFSFANGGTIVFDGLNDYITFSSSQLAPGTGAFTWNFWCKLNDFSTYSILFSGTGSNTNYGVIFLNPTNGSAGLGYYALGNRIQDDNTSFGSNWWCITFVGNGGANGSRNLKLYRNAVQAGSTYTYDYNFTSSTPIVGTNHDSYNEVMRGNIANFSYYNKALSASEILQNYNTTKGRFGL